MSDGVSVGVGAADGEGVEDGDEDAPSACSSSKAGANTVTSVISRMILHDSTQQELRLLLSVVHKWHFIRIYIFITIQIHRIQLVDRSGYSENNVPCDTLLVTVVTVIT